MHFLYDLYHCLWNNKKYNIIICCLYKTILLLNLQHISANAAIRGKYTYLLYYYVTFHVATIAQSV